MIKLESVYVDLDSLDLIVSQVCSITIGVQRVGVLVEVEFPHYVQTSCDNCNNGGVVDDKTGECVCRFTGPVLQVSCLEMSTSSYQKRYVLTYNPTPF